MGNWHCSLENAKMEPNEGEIRLMTLARLSINLPGSQLTCLALN